jgi:hypothetical protein
VLLSKLFSSTVFTSSSKSSSSSSHLSSLIDLHPAPGNQWDGFSRPSPLPGALIKYECGGRMEALDVQAVKLSRVGARGAGAELTRGRCPRAAARRAMSRSSCPIAAHADRVKRPGTRHFNHHC